MLEHPTQQAWLASSLTPTNKPLPRYAATVCLCVQRMRNWLLTDHSSHDAGCWSRDKRMTCSSRFGCQKRHRTSSLVRLWQVVWWFVRFTASG